MNGRVGDIVDGADVGLDGRDDGDAEGVLGRDVGDAEGVLGRNDGITDGDEEGLDVASTLVELSVEQ